MVSAAQEAAEAAVEAGVGRAPTPKDSNPVQWPKWRDICESMKTNGASIAPSVGNSVSYQKFFPGDEADVVLTLKNLLSSI